MESGCNHHRSSSESSVDVCRLSANPANGNGSISSEPLDRISPLPTMPGDTSTSVKSESNSSQLADPGKNKQNKALALFATKFFDDRIPLKKKLKWLKRVATVKNDGTVQFEVPGDIKPPNLDIKAGVDTLGASNEEPVLAELPDLRPLQIVMLIVGTRGDVQPFIAIGKRLQEHGHRVRLATHSNFKDFVLTAGLEFFPLGGDPKVLAGYMVKNKGFLPSGPSEIHIQRSQIKDIIISLYPACKDPDPDTQIPFKAEAIIANPPVYGHIHVAEALKIPLHIIFTMPWTPTSEFPHPLSRVKQPVGYRLSYQIVDALIWLGIRDMINEFRKKKLKLRPVTYLCGSYGTPLDVPYAYIWSPHVVAKPKDWGPKIDVLGFCFLDLASTYQPPESLVWLEEACPRTREDDRTKRDHQQGLGGSCLHLNLYSLLLILYERWGNGRCSLFHLSFAVEDPPKSIYLLDNCPPDWLLPRCSAVVNVMCHFLKISRAFNPAVMKKNFYIPMI